MCLCDHTKGTQFELFLFQLFKVVSAFYKNEKSIFKSLRSLKKSCHTKDTCNCIHSCDKKKQSADITLTTRKIRWHKVLRLRSGYNQHSILSCKF